VRPGAEHVPTTDCPNCEFPLAHSTERAVHDEVPVYLFECEECGHEWTKPI
jgi:predicted nucleic acid-binding Zn ribbon protein